MGAGPVRCCHATTPEGALHTRLLMRRRVAYTGRSPIFVFARMPTSTSFRYPCIGLTKGGLGACSARRRRNAGNATLAARW